jgi:hypothetical protein
MHILIFITIAIAAHPGWWHEDGSFHAQQFVFDCITDHECESRYGIRGGE